jgi:hypothetical protein
MSNESQTQVEPQSVGTLTEEEMGMIAQLRQAATQLLNNLGQLELRKSQIVAQLQRNEGQAQQILVDAKNRLGIPEGAAWQVQENGEVLAVMPSEEETSTEG